MDLNNNIISFDPVGDLIEANNTAYRLSKNGQFLEAKEYIDKTIEYAAMFISSGIQISVLSAKDYAKIFALAGFIYGELDDSCASVSYYQHYQFLKTQLKHGFQDIGNITLYQFRCNRSYVIDNLKQNQFTFADPRNQNDIVDSPIFAWVDYVLGKGARFDKHIPYLKESFNGYKIASFCRDSSKKRAIENTLMWAHYADCHRGFCIQYHFDHTDFRRDDKSKLFAARLFPVNYLPEDNCILDLSDTDTALSSKNAYFTKSYDWHYENEVRMISYNPTDSEEYPPFQLGPKSRISAIYFGVKCPESTIKTVKDSLVGRNVTFYRMEINPHNIYSLIDKQII